MITLGGMLNELAEKLASAGIGEPRLEARMILTDIGDIDDSRLIGFPDDTMDTAVETEIRDVVARRCKGEPLAHILGHKEFWSLSLWVTKDTLIPRPDSETAIELALDYLDEKGFDRRSPWRILDLGTGSGCLLLALLTELPEATGLGIDISKQACKVAQKNTEELGLADRVRIICGDWTTENLAASSPDQTFDIILCNPPYIPESDIATLARNVRDYEPRLALNGGADGLDAYRHLAPKISGLLTQNGAVIFEFGMGQVVDIKKIIEKNDLKVKSIRSDISKVDRCILATVVIS